MGIFRKAYERVQSRVVSRSDTYLACLSKPIWEDVCLFEAGQGSNVNGNMFSLVRTLLTREEFSGYKPLFVVKEDVLPFAEERFARYGLTGVEFPVRETDRYKEALARAKYLFTDNSFPTYFVKRPEQVYLNTWHGTPLKHLGLSDIKNSLLSFANIQKNYLAADYALFPNALTQRVFMEDYSLGPLFSGSSVLCDYPRNDVLISPDLRNRIRADQGIAQKQVLAYMPTWRGTGRSADVKGQVDEIRCLLKRIDSGLTDDQLLYVNLHFLVSERLDCTGLSHVRRFPAEYETYDFLAACDALITDYSSVFFDFAVTGRSIFLFAYDEQEYTEQKGLYIPLRSMPFPVAGTPEELVEAIAAHRGGMDYPSFSDEYCRYSTGSASRDVLRLVLAGDPGDLAITKHDPQPIDTVLFASDLSQRDRNAVIEREVATRADGRTLFAFGGRRSAAAVETLERLRGSVPVLALPMNYVQTTSEKVRLALSRRSALAASLLDRGLRAYYGREAGRLFHSVAVRKLVDLIPTGSYIAWMLKGLACERVALLRDEALSGVYNRSSLASCVARDYRTVRCNFEADRAVQGDELLQTLYSRGLRMSLWTRRYRHAADGHALQGLAYLRKAETIRYDGLCLCLTDGTPVGTVRPLLGMPSARGGWVRYRACVPYALVAQLPIYNPILLSFDDGRGGAGRCGVKFNHVDRKHTENRVRGIHIDSGSHTTTFFRQMGGNRLQFVVRETVATDLPKQRAKVMLAWLVALPVRSEKRILVYEKNSSHYEESGSVVFERLVDEGYRNVRFVLDRNSPDAALVNERYRPQVVWRNSFAHYLWFFSAKTFIGSENTSHAIDLHPAGHHLWKRIEARDLNFVFLQHGVMYMVSLDAEQRSFFRRKRDGGKYRVVVSSELERAHFVELASYAPDMLYVCGLPKFDRAYQREGASKIVIMPTWRPWEYSQARADFTRTGYYNMVMGIYRAVPDDLKDDVVICPHPLFLRFAMQADLPIKDRMLREGRYDDLLRDTKLLITDYSSIAYDAFYRGANVIFYWKELDACMGGYGPSAHIMMGEELAFGDICMREEELPHAIEVNAHCAQREEHRARFGQIVEFHDGHNTDRLMALLRKDGLI